MPEWDGLLSPVSCGERSIIDGVRTLVAYSTYRFLYFACVSSNLLVEIVVRFLTTIGSHTHTACLCVST